MDTAVTIKDNRSSVKVTTTIEGEDTKEMTSKQTATSGAPEKVVSSSNAQTVNKKFQDDEKYPENVQSVRERECYRLYQKMSNMGLNVSFDTVMRGMLTPTELRVIQKKRDLQMARQATIDQAEEEAKLLAELGKKRNY